MYIDSGTLEEATSLDLTEEQFVLANFSLFPKSVLYIPTQLKGGMN